MAKSYLDIQNSIKAGNIMDWTNALTRLSGVPVDVTEVYDSYAKAVEYAAINPVAYEGQVISVTAEGDTTVYVITPAPQGKYLVGEGDSAVEYDVYLKEVGSVPTGDQKSVDVVDGVITIHGFSTASVATLPRKTASGEIEWAPVDAIVQGDGNTKTVVASADESIKIVPTYNDSTDTWTYDISVAIIDAYSKTEADELFALKTELYDDSELRDRVSTVESNLEIVSNTVSNHDTRIAKVESFFETADGESLTEALDTLIEIQKEIESDNEGAAAMAASIAANTDAIAVLNGDSSTEGSIAKAIADKDAEYKATYSTISDFNAHKNTMDATLSSYALKTEVEEELATKVDSAELTHSTDTVGEGVTVVDGKLSIVIDAYTKAETLAQINEVIDKINDNSESAASVGNKLDTYITTNDAAVGQLNTTVQGHTAQIGAVESTLSAVSEKADANELAIQTLTNGQVATNRADIDTISERLGSAEGNVNTLLTKVATAETDISNLKSKDVDLEASVNDIIAQIEANNSTQEAKNTELLAAITANTTELGNKANASDVYTKTEVDEALENLDQSALETAIANNTAQINANTAAISANTNAIAGLVGNDTEMTIREIAADELNIIVGAANSEDTITNVSSLINYVNNNGAEIAALTGAVDANTAKLAGITGTVMEAINVALAGAKLNASNEITIDENNYLGIGEVSVEKLVVKEGTTFVIHGGSSAK